MGFPGGSAVKNPPAMQELKETRFQSLGQEDPLEKDMASVFLPGEPMDGGAQRHKVHRLTKTQT